jgi:NAD(P)H-dependent FMN reductase
MPRLAVIIASSRPGRLAVPVAEWFVSLARQRDDFEVDVVDLAEVDLPFLDEPNHPRLRQYQHDHTLAWSNRVDAADAFVIVTPEYNYGMPAILKNALDYLHHEWAHKPVGFVSYGGISAGTRSVQMTKQSSQRCACTRRPLPCRSRSSTSSSTTPGSWSPTRS